MGLALPSSFPKVKVLTAQSCPTVCDPVDCGPPGSSVHGILQARTLERVATPFSRGSSPPRDRTWVAHIAGRFFSVWATREACFSILSPVPTVTAVLWIFVCQGLSWIRADRFTSSIVKSACSSVKKCKPYHSKLWVSTLMVEPCSSNTSPCPSYPWL